MSTEIGALSKMKAQRLDNGEIQYQLPIGDQRIELNPLIGKELTLIYHNEIRCCHCNRKTKN